MWWRRLTALCLCAVICGALAFLRSGRQIANANVERMLTTAVMMARTFHQEHVWMTLQTCTQPLDDGTTYVITGDIDAMWIRDSSAEFNPYIPLAQLQEKQEGKSWLRDLLEGLIRRQAQFILTDPYANSFTTNFDSTTNTRLNRGAFVFTGNYELDSGAYFFRLLSKVHDAFPDTTVVGESMVHQAVKMMVALYRQEQEHAMDESQYRYPQSPPWELPGPDGRGNPIVYTGMIWGAFRPSDDALTYGYNIPANLFLAAHLGAVESFARKVWDDSDLAKSASQLRADIIEAVDKYGKKTVEGKEVYCFEVDGKGACNFMDDANVPSLLALPYLDPSHETYDEEVYKATRALLLSKTTDPWYFQGTAGSGVGSPHTGPNRIWPMALIMQAWTAESQEEKARAMKILMDDAVWTRGLPESFNKDNAMDITRPWFAWPNALLGELLMRDDPSYAAELLKEKIEMPARRHVKNPVSEEPLYQTDPDKLRRADVVLPKPEFYKPRAQATKSEVQEIKRV